MTPHTMKGLGNLLTITAIFMMLLFIMYIMPFFALQFGWENIAAFGTGYPTTVIVLGRVTISSSAFDLYFLSLLPALVWGKLAYLTLIVGFNISDDARALLSESKPKWREIPAKLLPRQGPMIS